MKYLLIDTSLSYALVSIICNNEILALFNDKVDNDMSSRIIPIIEDCLKKSNIELKDINKIFVVNGPGSFTGVRIGVTVSKIISWSLNIDLISLSSLELLATSSTSSEIIPMINARRGNVFAGGYDKNLNTILPNGLYNLDELIKEHVNATYISYDLFEDKNINLIKPNLDIIKIIKKHENDKPVNPHALIPNYLKKTEAEENLNDKGI